MNFLRRVALGFALSAGLLTAALAGIPGVVVQTPPARDQANAVVLGSFTGTGQSLPFVAWGQVNVVIYGSTGPNGSWNATVRLERSFDGGTTWIVAGVGGSGAQAVWNTPNQDVSVVYDEPELGVMYRLNCTVYASGTVNYRMSTTGGTSTTWHP